MSENCIYGNGTNRLYGVSDAIDSFDQQNFADAANTALLSQM